MTSFSPRISVIVASTTPLAAVPDCIEALLQQQDARPIEIILVYAAEKDLPKTMKVSAANVEFLRLPQAASLPQLLGAALERTSGEIIAITDATCMVGPHWISSILKAHAAPQPVIGGAVEPDGLNTLVDWAGYFCDYGQFMFPLSWGTIRHVPGINISFKREALARGKEFVEGEFWKAFWCQHLQATGSPLYIEPSILVFYRKTFSFWPFLRLRYHHARCFAGMRLGQLSFAKRALYILGSPLLPALFFLRLLRGLLPKRNRRRQLMFASPVILLALTSWALGEFLGYLLGPGTSCCYVK